MEVASGGSVSEGHQQLDPLLAQYKHEKRQPRQEWLDLQAQIPLRLYHYTNLSGLKGIIESNSLWVSDVRYMNDTSELTYAADLIEGVVTEVIASPEFAEIQGRLQGRFNVGNFFKFRTHPFIACFCEKRDLLSQWRGYSFGQAAFSLGFDLAPLAKTGSLPSGTFLRRVIYTEDDQRELVRSEVEAWLRTFGPMLVLEKQLQSHSFYSAVWALQDSLNEYCLTFKHPTFEEEQEWRLIKLVDLGAELRSTNARRVQQRNAGLPEELMQIAPPWPNEGEGIEIKFRASPVGLVPYVEQSLHARAGVLTGRLPLLEVRQGPTVNPELSLESLKMFLDSEGFRFHTEVSLSTVPLRPHQ